jgi:hypothetical protein
MFSSTAIDIKNRFTLAVAKAKVIALIPTPEA